VIRNLWKILIQRNLDIFAKTRLFWQLGSLCERLWLLLVVYHRDRRYSRSLWTTSYAFAHDGNVYEKQSRVLKSISELGVVQASG
jgi:hypothetical protein